MAALMASSWMPMNEACTRPMFAPSKIWLAMAPDGSRSSMLALMFSIGTSWRETMVLSPSNDRIGISGKVVTSPVGPGLLLPAAMVAPPPWECPAAPILAPSRTPR